MWNEGGGAEFSLGTTEMGAGHSKALRGVWWALWDTPQILPPTPRGDTSGRGVLTTPNRPHLALPLPSLHQVAY